MKQYLKYLTPDQKSPLPGQNMIENSAGGFSFRISDQERLERFLLLGTDGGTYYTSEKKLTLENANFLIDMIKKKPIAVLSTILTFCEEKRALKHDPILFAYALCLTFYENDPYKLAYDCISKICFTPTHLFTLLAFLKPLRGWSRGLRRCIANWYLQKDTEKLAYQMIKYRSRAGYTHKDVLRLCHVKCDDTEKNQLLRYLAGKCSAEQTGNYLVKIYDAIQNHGSFDLVTAISLYNLTWEMVPTNKLNNVEVLKALLPEMPSTALMRNLNRFAYNKMTMDNNDTTKLICSKLTNEEKIKEDFIHPISVLNTLITYGKGKGDKGIKTWNPNQHILDALHEMYGIAIKALLPTNKRILVGIDVSGSMSSSKVSGLQMSASTLSLVLAHTLFLSEPNVDVICFDTQPSVYPFGKRSSLDEILKFQALGGGTNCAIPIAHAIANRKAYDAIVILTDNETWSGDTHAYTAICNYRKNMCVDTKIIEVALVDNPISNMPQDDKNCLRIVGFDANVITLLQKYI